MLEASFAHGPTPTLLKIEQINEELSDFLVEYVYCCMPVSGQIQLKKQYKMFKVNKFK